MHLLCSAETLAQLAQLPEEDRQRREEERLQRKREAAEAERLQRQRVEAALAGEGDPLRIVVDCSFSNKPDNDKLVGWAMSG